MKPNLDPSIVSLADAKRLSAFGDEVVIHLSGEQTGGQFCLFTSITPPGGGPPPHYHEHEDEWFMPLEGEVEISVDGQWQRLDIGTAVFVPRGTVHTFRNAGKSKSHLLTQTLPSGFETFFEKCSMVFATPGPPDMDRIIQIAADHGIHFVQPDE